MRRLPPFHLSIDQQLAMSKEIQLMLEKGAIQEVLNPTPGFTSNMFLVPKKDGDWRPIINLKTLNQYVAKQHFKMEDIRTLRDIICPKDYMTKLDLKDAYFSVPVAESDRKYLRFEWNNRVYEYTCLPFGLTSAPWIFTKLLKPALTFLRQRGSRCLMYLDDMLLLGRSPEETKESFHLCQKLISSLGFTINWQKTVKEPTQKLEFLGFVINTIEMTLSITQGKQNNLMMECRRLISNPHTTLRNLAHVIGIMTSVSLAILPAPLHYRNLQFQKNNVLAHHPSYESSIRLNGDSIQDLQWWCNHSKKWNGRPIHPPTPQMTLETDASNTGWGAYYPALKQKTGGPWNRQEMNLHINSKELLAAWIALQTFASTLRHAHIHIKIDNTTAVAYVNRMGGVHSWEVCQIAIKMWNWCLERQLTISAEHLPGSQNVTADFESRNKKDPSEWELNQEIFLRIQEIRGECQVDLFASRLSAKLPTYYSWKPDPGAAAVDALNQDWGSTKGYAFPPFCLIGRCLTKIKRERVPQIILITPLWQSQPWFPVLMEMITEVPLLLPTTKNLLLDPQGNPHPLLIQGHLQLVAWSVSGQPSRIEAFQRRQSQFFVPPGEPTLKLPTPVLGRSGLNGASNIISIPFQHLW